MDYFYEPEVAARTAAYVNYVTPVAPARDVLARTDPETAENPLIFPDDATRQRLSGYPVLDVNEEQQMNEAFARVSGS
jgi:spermidine/putrescine transport system substrate-binding protein